MQVPGVEMVEEVFLTVQWFKLKLFLHQEATHSRCTFVMKIIGIQFYFLMYLTKYIKCVTCCCLVFQKYYVHYLRNKMEIMRLLKGQILEGT